MRKFYFFLLLPLLLFLTQVASSQQRYFVNDNSQLGDVYSLAVGNNSNPGTPSSPFATIAHAVSIAVTGDTIYIDAGSYTENVILDKGLILKGAQAGVNPGNSLNRGSETILYSAINGTTTAIGIALNASNITIDGLLLDGDNPNIGGGISINGKDANAGFGLFNQQFLVNGLKVKNNIIVNYARYGIFLQRQAALTPTENIDITTNHFDNISSASNNGRAVGCFANAYANVTNNNFTRVVTGIVFANSTQAATLPVSLTGNYLETYSTGVLITNNIGSFPSFSVSNNVILTADLNSWVAPGATTANSGNGVSMAGLAVTGNISFNNNLINNKRNGLELYTNTSSGINISGGSVANSSEVGLFLVGGQSSYNVNNISLSGNKVALDASSDPSAAQHLSFNNVTVTGGITGFRFYGNQLFLNGNTLGNTQFSGQTTQYVYLTVNAFEGQTIDVSNCSFEGVPVASMTLAQLMAAEDKLMHRIDYNNVGYFKLKPNEVYVTANSFFATLPLVFGTPTTSPNINRAVAAANDGDIIHIGPGTFVNQILVDKSVGLIGAGRELTHIQYPASGNVPPPGFNELGVIQTSNNIGNVIVRSLSVTADNGNHAIFLQTGGEVSECSLSHAGQGIFVRDPGSTPRTALLQNNIIHNVYIGINCQGSALTATATNNQITLSQPSFSAGFLVGLDFGPIAQFTATGNFISNYKYCGFQANSNNSLITQNYIVGDGPAIQQFSGNPANATCNWYGSREAEIVAPKISGNVNYINWLVQGGDNDPGLLGFQPIPTACNGRQTKFYVNDNNQTGDVLTTAIGNNANNGFSSAPFATIEYALTKVQPFDTIFIDGGDYTAATVLLDKSITILGPNHSISPNNSANKALYNTSRNTEARISGVTFVVLADWININGLRLSSGNAISLTNDFSHVKFNNNYFDVTGNASTVVLQGASTPIVAFDFAITDNRFERADLGNGNAILLGRVKSIWADNNVFIETSNSPNKSTAVRTNGGLLVDNAFFAGSYFKKMLVGFAPGYIQNFGIFTNVFDSCTQGFNMLPQGGVSNNVFLNSNTFKDMRTGRSILLRGGSNAGITGFSIAHNTINQSVNGINGIVGMIHIEYGTSITSGLTTISNNKINITGDYTQTNVGSNCGIVITGNHSTTNITNNEIIFSAINSSTPAQATALPPVPAGIFLNTDGNVVSGVIPASAIFNINNNKIHGFPQSIAIYDPVNGATPAVGFGYLTTGASVTITNNSFLGGHQAIDNGITSQSITATCNWYGSTDESIVVPRVLGPATYMPWLVNGDDNEPTVTGFQPVPGNCTGRQTNFYVNDNSQTGDVFTTATGSNSKPGIRSAPFGTIDHAFNIAQAGDTIFVDAGTYDLGGLTYLINKQVTFIGANHQISPNDPSNKKALNLSRNTESEIINGRFTIGSSGISMIGFTLDIGNRTAINLVNTAATNNDFGNFRFEKNRLKINSALIQFGITGKFVATGSEPVTSGYNFVDNRFEKLDGSAGATLVFNYIKDINVSNNSFVATGSSRTQSGLFVGNANITSGVTISNNVVDQSSTFITANRVSSILIDANKIDNTTTAISYNNPIAEAAQTVISNNILDNPTGNAPFILYTRAGGNGAGSSTTFLMESNIFTSTATPGSGTLYGSLNLTFNGTVQNPSAIVRRNTINYSGDFSAVESQFIRALSFRGKMNSVIVENNDIVLNNSGGLLPVSSVGALPANSAITFITDFGSIHPIPSSAVLQVNNNKVHGYRQSVSFYDGATGTGAANPYLGYGNLPAGVSASIYNNSFTGDSISINNGNIGQAVTATCNWYGTAKGQEITEKLSISSVNYSPWLVNGTDADVAIGFQPLADACTGTPVVASLVSVTNVSCFGANNGSINITATNGTLPYTFAWTKDDVAYSTVEDLSNLEPGTYSLIVTDANGTTASITEIVISEPLLLTASASGTTVSCFNGSNGSASATAEGGTAPYTFLWSNGATTEEINNLVAGNYSVTITDANGCTATANYEVTQPSLLTISANGTSTSCFNSVTTIVNGGAGSYNYLWSNGAVTPSISSIVSGTYSVTVTDANGCSASASATVTANEAFNPSAVVVNVSCFGTPTGSITVTNVNAVAPFLYSIDGGLNFQAENVFGNLAAGTYTITVKDANGCTGFVTKTVTQPTQLSATLVSVQNSCFGASTGSITVSVSGGTTAYSYQWSGPSGFISSQLNINNLAAGNYIFTVTDSKNCTATLNVTVASTNPINVGETINNISCKGETNGSILLNVSGGSGSAFTYSWNTGATTSSIANLGVGNYNVTITDAGTGCIVSRSFTITQPASLINLSTTKTNATGCLSLGTITATGTGGSGGFTYRLNSGNYQPTGTFTGLLAGSYTVWVKDMNGCTKSTVVAITDNGSDEFEGNNSKNQAKPVTAGQPAYARLALATDVADWFRFTTTTSGSYTLNLTHPSINYTFNLYAAGNNTPPLVATVSTATTKQYSLAANTTYYISVTGALSFNCYTLMVTAPGVSRYITETKEPVMEVDILTATAYPNPHKGSFNISVKAPQTGKLKIELFGINGQKLGERTIDMNKNETRVVPFTGIRAGTIIYRVQLGKHSTNGKIIGAN